MGDCESKSLVNGGYDYARKAYAAYGIDTDLALERMKSLSLSLQCWQGDDVRGFEADYGAGGGILSTGNYFGRASNGDELRDDFGKAMSLIPGKHRINLHAIYGESEGERIGRDRLTTAHFGKWIEWARKAGMGGVDFNPTCFGHPMAASGFTLSSMDEAVRKFWVRHVKACRDIAEELGKALGTPCVHNIWIPDGFKDLPADRLGYRRQLVKSLDEIFEDKKDGKYILDTFESKLFGIGLEAYTVASHEFVTGYCLSNGITICYDLGHFHPTESIADKISSTLLFSQELLLHLSRPVRWDSDHVVILGDELLSAMQEVGRCGAFDRVHFALDFFDASINRITAWVTGARASLKAMLAAVLEPAGMLAEEERRGNYGNRLALMEEFKTLPFGAVWDKYCLEMKVPVGAAWLAEVGEYEEAVLKKRRRA